MKMILCGRKKMMKTMKEGEKRMMVMIRTRGGGREGGRESKRERERKKR